MSKNKSLSMKTLSTNHHKKLIRINGFGKKVHVPYEEFLALRKMDREKMKTLKDSLTEIIKSKKKIYARQNAYDIDSLKKICIERELEFREAIVNLQKEIRKEKKLYADDMYNFYDSINKMVKNIYDYTNNEINERVKLIDGQIKINIANCEYKQNKIFDKKFKEYDEPFKYMNYCTYQMKQSMKDFDILSKKVNEFQELNHNYRKKLLKEKIKSEYILNLMKQLKIKNNTVNALFKKFKNNINEKTIAYTISNESPIYLSILDSKKIKNKRTNTKLSSFSTQKMLTTNNSINKDLLLTMDIPNKQIKRRPISGQRFATMDGHNNSTKRTNYSNSNTLQSYFMINNSKAKGKAINFKTISHKNIFNTKHKINKKNLSKMMLNTNPSYVCSTEVDYNENKQYTKSELNSIILIKKEIKNLKSKKNEILNKMNYTLPNNELYQSVVNIIEELRNDKDNEIVEGINNKYVKNYMKAIPIQDKVFRKKFINLLFNDKNVFESIIKATTQYNYNSFNKNIVGAEKISK